MSITSSIIVPLALGILSAVIVFATLAGKPLPMISGPRAALIALLVIGMTMCAAGGIGQVGASGRWGSSLAIVGYLLGAAILVVIASVFTGWKLPLISGGTQGETQAVTAVAVLMAVKYLIGTAGYFFHLL